MSLRIPVTLQGGWLWNPSFSITEVNLIFLYLLSHNFMAIKGIVAEKLNIDTLSRVADDNRIKQSKAAPRQLHDRRIINKAMSMELLIALLLTWLDDSDKVGSNCCVMNELPNNHAPGKVADIIANYPPGDGGKAFKVLSEVSIKRRISLKKYREQLDQTLEHARNEIKDDPDKPVYGLVINGGDIATNKGLHAEYKRFLADNQLEPDGIIRVVPMYAVDFAGVMLNLIEGELYDFKSHVLAKVFDTVIDELRQEALPTEPNWMEKLWLDVIEEAWTPKLDLEEPEESDESADDKPDDDSKPK